MFPLRLSVPAAVRVPGTSAGTVFIPGTAGTCMSLGATEIAGVDNVARAKKQGLKTREWTRRHEETGVDNAGVSDRENNILVALSLHT